MGSIKTNNTNTHSIYKELGFTLIELLVVISIISLLASIVIVSTVNARNKAKVTRALADFHQINKAVQAYVTDTGRFPPDCSGCTAANDPMLNNLGVAGWRGPYMTIYDKAHPWGGHYSLATRVIDGTTRNIFIFNDDAPLSGATGDAGIIPLEFLTSLDTALDNGNLATGNATGNGLGFSSEVGSLLLILSL